LPKLNAYHTYLAIRGADALFFAIAFTTSAIYRFQMAGLDPLQLVLVGTALEASVFLLEVPTGIVADLFGRRLSVIIGYTLIGLGLILEGALPSFAAILLAQMIWGTGHTFTSGAIDAWLADELGEAKLAHVYLRGSQTSQAAAFFGIFAGVSIASLRLNWPLLVGGSGLLALSLFLIIGMPEADFKTLPHAKHNSWQNMGRMFSQSMDEIRRRTLLRTIMGISLFTGLYSEALDRLWQPHFLDSFSLPDLGGLEPIYWFGLISASTMILTIVATEVTRRRVGEVSHETAVRILFLLNAVLILSLLLFGLATNFAIALSAFGAVSVARRTGWPIFASWINRGIEPRVRATVLSTINQMDAVGQVVGGPIVGSVAKWLGLRAAMVAAGIIFAPVLALYGRARNQAEG
jgi:DHA3 family tetracycline resistance protein-like MFS transporter